MRYIDHRGLEHKISFSPQEDMWNIHVAERIGTSLSDSKDRWDALPTIRSETPMHPGHWQKLDLHGQDQDVRDYIDMQSKVTATSPCISEEPTGITNGKRKTSCLYGRSPNSLIRHITHVGEQYLASHQGFNDTGDNGSLHNLIRTNHRRSRQRRKQRRICLGCHPIWDGSNADRGPLLTIHVKSPPSNDQQYRGFKTGEP